LIASARSIPTGQAWEQQLQEMHFSAFVVITPEDKRMGESPRGQTLWHFPQAMQREFLFAVDRDDFLKVKAVTSLPITSVAESFIPRPVMPV
jgi:hypothetical protein